VSQAGIILASDGSDPSSIAIAPTTPGGTVRQIASFPGYVGQITHDASAIYFGLVLDEQGNVSRVPLAGGSPQVVATFGARLGVFRMLGDRFYAIVELGDGSSELRVVDGSGGAPSTVLKPMGALWNFADDGDRLVVVECIPAVKGTCGSFVIATVPKTGGSESVLTTVTSGAVQWLAASNGNVFWTEVTPLADAGDSQSTGRVMMMPTSGGQPKALADAETNVARLVATKSHLLWTYAGPETAPGTYGPGAIMSAAF